MYIYCTNGRICVRIYGGHTYVLGEIHTSLNYQSDDGSEDLQVSE